MDKENYMYGDVEKTDASDWYKGPGIYNPDLSYSGPAPGPVPTFDYDTYVSLRERIVMLLVTNAPDLSENEGFRLASRIENFIRTGAAGNV